MPDGSLYGTTQAGGAGAVGTVFKITTAGTLTTMHSFCSTAPCDAVDPYKRLVLGTDGNLYGTTSALFHGGTSQPGTIYRMTPSGVLTTLYNYCELPDCADGWKPVGPLIQGSDGEFYGTTYYSSTTAPGSGTIYKLNALVASLSSSSVSFGNQALFFPASKKVTLSANGVAKLTIDGIAISGPNAADFTQTNNCPAALAPKKKWPSR